MEFALSLPEIRTSVGSFLPRKAICSCRLVCHAWNHSFAPRFWHNFYSVNNRPILATMTNYNHLIQNLTISQRSPAALYNLHGFHNLKSLKVDTGSDSDSWSRQSTVELIPGFIQHQCTTITSLYLYFVDVIRSAEFWTMLQLDCPELRHLKVCGGHMTRPTLGEMWKTVCVLGVTHLHWNNTQLYLRRPGESNEPVITMDSKIRVFYTGERLRLDEEHVLQMMQHSPELRTIERVYLDGLCQANFVSLLQAGSWKELDSIRLEPTENSTNNFVTGMIKAMSRVRSLTVLRMSFGESAFKALKDHRYGLNVLQVVSLVTCVNVTSKMIRTFLEVCPRLVELVAGRIEGKDIVESQPWACAATLKLLEMDIHLSCLPEHEENKQMAGEETRAVLKRLAVLTRLGELKIGDELGGYVQRRFQVCLENGLDELRTLTEIESVEFNSCSLFLKEAEAAWMVEHWPRLSSTTLYVMNQIRLDSTGVQRLNERQILFYHVG